MSEERPFRKKAIGGFNREDVIEYIDKLLGELKAVKEENSRKDVRIAELEQKLDEYETAAASGVSAEAVQYDSPEDVLSQVDKILQSYLSKEE